MFLFLKVFYLRFSYIIMVVRLIVYVSILLYIIKKDNDFKTAI